LGHSQNNYKKGGVGQKKKQKTRPLFLIAIISLAKKKLLICKSILEIKKII
jgi:hypothetical protein